MKPHELDQAIKQHGVAPLYLIAGEEDYLRDQAVATIKAAVLGPGTGQEPGRGGEEAGGLEAFNYDFLYGDESEAAEILARAGEVPVFAPRRLMLLKAADKLPAREGEALLPYLKAPCETTTVVFVAAKLDGRLKFSQALSKSAVVVDCSPLYENQVSAWIRAEAGRLGVKLHEDAALLLKETAGSSLYLVRRELEKLATYLPDGATAGPAEVAAVRGVEPGASVFDLAAAIGARERGRVLRITARNLEAGEAPVRILGSLVWQYRQIWKAKDLLRQGRGEAEAARMLRMAPFKVKEFLGRFSDSSLKAAFRMFLETDSKLKGGSATAPHLVLESLLLALCGPVKDAGARGVQPPKPVATGSVPTGGTVRSGRTSGC
ncbi:MAG: DNA polymerase III subunit delta [Nitrospirae bacterium]|nr:MAG: DNA polymerase III subunit delta [Nitrospirota bacterium]